MYEIAVTRTFVAEHAVGLYGGLVEASHRHDWSVEVAVGAERPDEIGVVMDFHLLQEQVDRLLADVEGRSFNDVPPFAGKRGVNPTAERIASWLGDHVARSLPPHVRLVSVTVGEAPGCAATYRPSSWSGPRAPDAAD